MKNSYVYLGFAFTSLLTSCISEVDFPVSDKPIEEIMIDGDFTDQEGPHRLFLNYAAPFGVSRFKSVENAAVWLVDDTEARAQYLPVKVNSDTFYYELPRNSAMQGIAGRSYHVEITLPDGRIYKSVPQVLPQRVNADSIVLEGSVTTRVSTADVVIEERNAIVSVESVIPAGTEPFYLRWDAHSVFYFQELVKFGPFDKQHECFIPDLFNQQRVVTQEIAQKNGQKIRVEIGKKLIDYSFENSLYFNVIQRSINKETFDYWNLIAKVANPQGTVFDTPPASIRGNIFNEANPKEIPLGYFEVAAVDTIRRKVFNGVMGEPYFVLPYCSYANPWGNGPANHDECLNCIILKNSTYTKPHYWID